MHSYGVTRFVTFLQVVRRYNDTIQVEYLVVTYKEDDQRVTLSLRQADILTALASDEKLMTEGGCVPALQDIVTAGSEYVQQTDMDLFI